MALDALFLSHLAHELNTVLPGAKIDKIQQPERDELVLSLRAKSGNMSLLLSAGGTPRMHLTHQKLENPKTPPMFCMLLRKHLQGGTVLSVSQPGLERALDLSVSATNELGEKVQRVLTLELMGRYTNIILRDENDRVVDCLKRVDITQASGRGVLPGLFYRLPEPPEKRDPYKVRRAELFDLIRGMDAPCDKFLVSSFLGMSPLVAREICHRATGDASPLALALSDAQAERIANEFEALLNAPVRPMMYRESGLPKELSFTELTQYENRYEAREFETFSELLDAFYGEKSAKERMMRKSATVRKVVENAISRTVRKIAVQEEELLEAKDRERIREEAELITANLYQIPNGVSRVTVIDYYKEDTPERELTLDRRYTPQEYAAKLFHRYQRMKNAEAALTEQLHAAKTELLYLESVLESLNRAECERDLSEIREELGEVGYIRIPRSEKRGKGQSLQVHEYRASDGTPIYVGRNNRQNDLLTMKTARKGDIWFHTQKIPGAHVILACGDETPKNETLTEAAVIAAYHSNARSSAQVPVDYTRVKNVKKPPGARPGMVNYFRYETAFVTPDAELVKKLSQ